MPFFAVKNLIELSMSPCEPWTFKIETEIPAQVRADKQSRQEWYRAQSTQHQFYTLIEPVNPNQRPSVDANPPLKLWGVAADYDVALSDSRLDEAVAAMKIKPAWIERSLGGNARLIWTFQRPLMVDSADFCTFLLMRARKWLNLDLLPALDEGALISTTRLLCNGGIWRPTGASPVDELTLQAFFVKAAQEYSVRGKDLSTLPLDVAEAALKARYPNFSWPVDFTLESQGPSFWVPGSTSPMSAIVKPHGLYTFSAHATKAFYSWGDLLGKEFITQFEEDTIAKATLDVWWDSQYFWRRKDDGNYTHCSETEFSEHLEVHCRMSGKPDPKTGISPLKAARAFIRQKHYVLNAVPFVGRPPGLTIYQGDRYLNTWINKAIHPADKWSEWGPNGRFPLISYIFDHLFDPAFQKEIFLAWFRLYYISIHDMKPRPGQNCIMMGGINCGKTFTNREIVGASVGGFVDGSNHLVRGEAFNSHMFRVPHWVSDDDTMNESEATRQAFFNTLKRMAANPSHLHNKKYEQNGMTEWMGRILITNNLDAVSSRMLSTLQDGTSDKINFFRCAAVSTTIFPERDILSATIKAELPFFLRWLVDWTVPDWIETDVRFGYKSFQEEKLREQAQQGSKAAPLSELLCESLNLYFADHADATEWRGTMTKLDRLLRGNPLNEATLRSIPIEKMHRYLENIQRSGRMRMTMETNEDGHRVFIFPRNFRRAPSTPPTSYTPTTNSDVWTTPTQSDASSPASPQ